MPSFPPPDAQVFPSICTCILYIHVHVSYSFNSIIVQPKQKFMLQFFVAVHGCQRVKKNEQFCSVGRVSPFSTAFLVPKLMELNEKPTRVATPLPRVRGITSTGFRMKLRISVFLYSTALFLTPGARGPDSQISRLRGSRH